VPLASSQTRRTTLQPSSEAARENWEEFGKDPEWQKVKAESEGKLVTKVESVFVNPTDYSPLK
jgi:hypothetical protein